MINRTHDDSRRCS